MAYNILRPWESLDSWQTEYISETGNCLLQCARQCGKSTAAAIKFGKWAVEHENHNILMIALTEKQAYNIFFKTLQYLQSEYPSMICKGSKKPTLHVIQLKNGSKIMCHACGLTGFGLVGMTIHKLCVDEAASMNREIFVSLMPSLSIVGGTMDLLSTPKGREGFFFEMSESPDFRKFYVSAEDCPRHDRDFLAKQKDKMSTLEYAQEYLAMFLSDLRRLFSDALIKRVCILKRRESVLPGRRYYLGVDVGAMGSDVSSFEIIDKLSKECLEHVESGITKKTLTTETTDKIIQFENIYRFKGIGIDDGGPGFGVFSELMRESKTSRKTIALNNASRPLDRDETKRKKILKEDMYLRLLSEMEHRRVFLLDDDEVKASLASIQYEWAIKESQRSEYRVFGNNSHVTEGIIRAVWLATQDQTLGLWAR